MADFSLFGVGSVFCLGTAALTTPAEGAAPAIHSFLSLVCKGFQVPTSLANQHPWFVHFCRNPVSCSVLYPQDVHVCLAFSAQWV